MKKVFSLDKLSKKQRKALVLILILAIVYVGFFVKGRYFWEGNLEVHFIDVGQGDSTFIKTPKGKTMLIDSGDNRAKDKVISYLHSQGTGKLDFLVATHPDTDHIGAMDDVVYTFGAKGYAEPKMDHQSRNYDNLHQALSAKNIPKYNLKRGDSINLEEGLNIKVLSPAEDFVYQGTNEYSIVLRIDYKNTSFILPGDAMRINEIDMIDSGQELECNVLKLGHHGSSTSSSMEFLVATDPDIAIISCSENNDYGHPHKEVIYNLNQLDIPFLITFKEGDIVLSSDGEKIVRKKDQDIIKQFLIKNEIHIKQMLDRYF